MFAKLKAATQPLFTSGQAHEVDLTATFDNVPEKVFVEDGVHYTPPGNRLLAEALRDAAQARC